MRNSTYKGYTGGKIGFTLAEVLITLSIIGVVAALTVPVITKKFERQQYISQYKATFSIVAQATKMIAADNGGTLVGAWSDTATWLDAYAAKLKVIKNCKYNIITGCFGSGYKLLDNTTITCPTTDYSILLANGISVNFNSSNSTSATMYIDINGPKGPNVAGKDMHIFEVNMLTGEMTPFYLGLSDATMEIRCPSDLKNCSDEYCGLACGARILRGDYATNY